MNKHEIMYKIEQILETTPMGVLATVGKDGAPRMRWMTPAVIKGRPDVLFAVTSPEFEKVVQLETHPEVEWMIQTRALDQVVNLKGRINVLDNPSIRSEIIEHLGKKLTVFWRVNPETTDFLVLETIIGEATFFRPMKNYKETVRFNT